MNAKRIADAVHGTVELSALEMEVISSPAFSRLRNIKQLGLAHLVYPGADYSRFSHSIGVCHVTGRLLDSIGKHADLSESESELYRLAALLHDVGHYPFSHTTEHSIQDHYAATNLITDVDGPDSGNQEDDAEAIDHEKVGALLLERDPAISALLRKYQIDHNDVSAIFNRQDPPKFANLVSSDLDADRIDYLLRTAHHTGLPYGSVDLDYLISQLSVDNAKRICLNRKGLRAADHFLLCRFFDYQQVAFHKTVAAMELVLGDVIAAMCNEGRLRLGKATVDEMITTGAWSVFDDAYMMGLIREHYAEAVDGSKQRAAAIIERTPPKLVWESEFFEVDRARFSTTRQLAKVTIKEMHEQFGIAPDLTYGWYKSTPLTKIGPTVPIEREGGQLQKDEDRTEQAIRLASNGSSEPIVLTPNSITSVLAKQNFYALRIYVILTDTQIQGGLRQEISRYLSAKMPA